jgi:hypothetical protein
VAGENLGEGALATAIAAHQGVDLTGPDGEVDAMEDRLFVDPSMEILDLEQDGGIWTDHGNLRGASGRGKGGEPSGR